MIQRPKSVSFVAASFVVIAIPFAYGAWHRTLHFQSGHGVHYLLSAVFLAVVSLSFFVEAYGLWRLSAKSRVPGVFLACVVTALVLYAFVIGKSFWAEFRTQAAPEMAGGIFALVAFLTWLLSPIYILTRPTIRNAFQEHNVA